MGPPSDFCDYCFHRKNLCLTLHLQLLWGGSLAPRFFHSPWKKPDSNFVARNTWQVGTPLVHRPNSTHIDLGGTPCNPLRVLNLTRISCGTVLLGKRTCKPTWLNQVIGAWEAGAKAANTEKNRSKMEM